MEEKEIDIEIDKSDFKIWENNKITVKYKEFLYNFLEQIEEDLLNNRVFTVTGILGNNYSKGQMDAINIILDIDFDDIQRLLEKE